MLEKSMKGPGLHGYQDEEKVRRGPSVGSQVHVSGAGVWPEVGVPFGDRMGRPGLWQRPG